MGKKKDIEVRIPVTESRIVDRIYKILELYIQHEPSAEDRMLFFEWLSGPGHEREKDLALRRLFDKIMDDSECPEDGVGGSFSEVYNKCGLGSV